MTPTLSARLLRHGALLLGLMAPAISLSAAEGELVGRVVNATTGEYVANARITVEGTTLEALTDASGWYAVTSVPLGEARVHASYVGLAPQTRVVAVRAGRTEVEEFALRREAGPEAPDKIVELDKITVVENREMSAQAVAMNEQRTSPALKSVVALDEYPGEGGSGNLGEFLKYLPGLAITYSGVVPIDVSVRGLPASMTPITVDGGAVPSAAASDTRGGSLTGMPMANISRVEVTKVPTPDMPASSLGGAVNLISKSAFEQKQAVFTYNLYSTFNADAGFNFDEDPAPVGRVAKPHIGPSLSLGYVLPVNKSLGVSFGGSYIFNPIPVVQTSPTWNLQTLTLTSAGYQVAPQVVTLKNGYLGADWKLGANHTFAVNYQQRNREAEAPTSGLVITSGAGATGGPTWVQGAPTGVGTISQSFSWMRVNTQVRQVTLRHRFTSRNWKVETTLGYAETFTERLNPDYFTSATNSLGSLIIRGDGIAGTGTTKESVVPTTYAITTRAGVPVDPLDGGLLSITAASSTEYAWKRANRQWKSIVTRDFDAAVPLTLKFGYDVNRETYKQSGGTLTYTFRSASVDRTAQNYPVFDEAYNQAAPPILGGHVRWISLARLYDLSKTTPEYFILNEPAAHQSDVNNYKRLTETIAAGFVRVDGKFFHNRLWAVGGVRFERTTNTGVGPLVDPSASLQKDASGNLLRNAAGQTIPITTNTLEVAKLQYVKGGASTNRKYDGFFPSLNLSYALSDAFMLRGGYARTIGRPNRTNIIPGVTYSSVTSVPQYITINNTGLKPWTANSYDLALESYLFKGSSGSIGVFQKDITNFFTSTAIPTTPELLELYSLPDASDTIYELRTLGNSSTATRVRGYELNYRQALLFLPQWARGFQVFVNLTHLQVQGSNASDFTGFNPRTLSYGVNLTRPRYAVKFLMQVQDETRRSVVAASASSGFPEGTFLWQGAKRRPTLTVDYRLTKRISLYGSATDFIHGFRDVQYRYATRDTPQYARYQRLQEWGWTMTLGLKGEF